MNKYLIEVPHGSGKHACDEAIKIFLSNIWNYNSDSEHQIWLAAILDMQIKDQGCICQPDKHQIWIQHPQISPEPLFVHFFPLFFF